MLRSILLSLLVLGCLPTPLHAQVAVTDLVPGQAMFTITDAFGVNGTTFTPHNPAAIQWGGPDRIGAGALEGDIEQKALLNNVPVGTQESEHKAGFGGLRVAWEFFAVAGSSLSTEEKSTGPPNPNFMRDSSTTNVQASLTALGGLMAVGFGREEVENREPFEIPQGSGNFFPGRQDITFETIGVSFNFSNFFYLGFARGTQERSVTLAGQAAPLFTIKADVDKAGVAIRQGGEWKWYVELYVLDFEPFVGSPDSGLKASTAVIQTNYSGWLLGFSKTDIDLTDDPTQPLRDETVEATVVDFGWAPDQGLAITMRWTQMDISDSDPGVPGLRFEQLVENVSLSLTFLF